MADTTEIPWAEKTYNPWFGCSPVHTGCENCYAKSWWKRLEVPDGRRKRAAASTLKQPYAWDRKAKRRGERCRVMLGSLMDFFEDHPDVVDWRQEVFGVIRDTPNLDWIIPTKRPDRVAEVWPGRRLRIPRSADHPGPLFPEYMNNIHLLASVSDQATFDAAVCLLRKSCGMVKSLGFSMEPLVGPIDAHRAIDDRLLWLDWLVIGGESGHGARVCDLEWIRDLVKQGKQGKQAGLAVFVKQWGDNPQDGGRAVKLLGKKGGDPSEWPKDLRIREYPKALMEMP